MTIGLREGASRATPVVVGLVLGLALGLGAFTFVYARGGSYLTDDPAACANCHVMNEQFDGWLTSSHRAVAVCNDCHTPDGFVAKYFTKALNGFHHSLAFTTGEFPDRIRIGGRNARIAERSCLKCHAGIVDAISAARHPSQAVDCVGCHRDAGHPH